MAVTLDRVNRHFKVDMSKAGCCPRICPETITCAPSQPGSVAVSQEGPPDCLPRTLSPSVSMYCLFMA